MGGGGASMRVNARGVDGGKYSILGTIERGEKAKKKYDVIHTYIYMYIYK